MATENNVSSLSLRNCSWVFGLSHFRTAGCPGGVARDPPPHGPRPSPHGRGRGGLTGWLGGGGGVWTVGLFQGALVV